MLQFKSLSTLAEVQVGIVVPLNKFDVRNEGHLIRQGSTATQEAD